MIRLRGVSIPSVPELKKPNLVSLIVAVAIVACFATCFVKAFLGFIP